MSDLQPQVKVRARKVRDGVCVIHVTGELTAYAEDRLMAAYNEACAADARTVILNFEQLEFMSSSGIGLLVTLLIRAQRQEQRLLACGLNEHYRHIFHLTRIDEAIAIHAGEAQALAALDPVPAR